MDDYMLQTPQKQKPEFYRNQVRESMTAQG